MQDIEEFPLKMCIVRNLLLKQCTLEELNHGDLPLYLVIHTRIDLIYEEFEMHDEIW